MSTYVHVLLDKPGQWTIYTILGPFWFVGYVHFCFSSQDTKHRKQFNPPSGQKDCYFLVSLHSAAAAAAAAVSVVSVVRHYHVAAAAVPGMIP